MPIEILTKTASADSSMLAFEFSADVHSFVYGLSGFNLFYPGKDHHLETMSISLIPNEPNNNMVVLNPQIQFNDDSGHHDADNSTICVTVIALTGDDNDARVLNTGPIANGAFVKVKEKKHAYNAYSFLSGFNLSYGHGVDHHVETLGAGTHAQQTSDTLIVNSMAEMYDKSNNRATNPSVNAGVIATFKPHEEVEMQIVRGEITNTGLTTVEFAKPVDQASLILMDFGVSFGNVDHHVKGILAGYVKGEDFPVYGDKKVVFSHTGCNMYDSSGNGAIKRNYTFLAIGRYA